jgi:nonsense-mediated mRNA decay protein 3
MEFLVSAQVARESDFGANNTVFLCKTHLGAFLQAGDIALGYDLARQVNADASLDGYIQRGYEVPDVLLVRKCFDDARAKRRARQRERPWKIKRLDMDLDDSNYHAKKNNAAEAQRMDEMEKFLEVRLPLR